MSLVATAEEKPVAASLEVPADALPAWVRISRRGVGMVLFFGATFWVLSWVPLWYTDLWMHVKYGQWIWANGLIPRTEPIMSLAEGMPYVDDAWLSQIIMFGSYWSAGCEGLSLLHTGTVLAIVGVLCAGAYRATNRTWLALMTLAVLAPLVWPHLTVVQPKMVGALLFVMLLYMVASRHWHGANWFLIPLLFVCWVNLHGSFLIGLAVLACSVLGHTVDAWRQMNRARAGMQGGDLLRWLLVSECAVVACLANPYGIEVFETSLPFPRSANLETLAIWAPLSVQSWAGIAFAGSILFLVWLLRMSRRPIAGTEGILLAVFGVASLPHTVSILWWWLLVPFLYLPHVGVLLDRYWPRTVHASIRSFKNTIVAIAMAWIAFACSAPGSAMIHNKPRSIENVMSRSTPIETSEYLRQHPPTGQIFNPVDWGDWLVWHGPADLKCLVTSEIHLIPEEIWKAYQRIYLGQDDWERTVQGLGIRTIVINKEEQKELLNQVRLSANWKIVHEDRLGAIAERLRSGPTRRS